MSPGLVVGQKGASDARPDPSGAWRVVGLGAAGIWCIGALDVGLLWVPPDFGSVEWEFGTISATVDALPLMTIGLIGVGAAGWARGSIRTCRVVAALAGVVVAGLLGLGALYGLSAPVAWQAVEPGMQRMLSKALAKTTGAGIVYVGLYATLAWMLWRHRRDRQGPSADRRAASSFKAGEGASG